MNGVVKFYNRSKNYGFITGEDGKEYFVHLSGIKKGVYIHQGDNVTFEVVEGDRGLKAENVDKAEGSQEQQQENTTEETQEEISEEAEPEEGEEAEEESEKTEEAEENDEAEESDE